MITPREHAIIAGKYRLIRQLGQGGMGSVWLAEHLTLCSHVAIKLIHVDMASSPEVLGRFLREAQAAASLRSPHVVQILDHGVDEGTPYIAMELLEGESLADRLSRVGRLQATAVARIMTEIGRAIGRAHEAGIVHRDLKPDNVFLVRNDDDEIAKVLDFGIAKAALPGAGSVGAAVSNSTRTGAVLGTPYYMSPEQAEGARTVDHRSDIWAMGVIAFECLLGHRPFDAETLGGLLLAICTRAIAIPSQHGAVPAGFDAWFARACNRDLTQRFASAREAALDLKRVCEGDAGVHVPRLDSSPDASGPASAISAPALSGPFAAAPLLSGALVGSPAAVPVQSVAGLSATQLEAAGVPKRRSKLELFAVLGGVALIVGSASFTWSHFKSGPAPAAPISAASHPPGSAPSMALTPQAALTLPASAEATQQAPVPVPTLAPSNSVASNSVASNSVASVVSATARPASASHGPTKRTPVSASAAPPTRVTAAPPTRVTAAPPTPKPPSRPTVNLGI